MYPDDQSPESGFARIVGMDPAADWLLGPALQDYLPPGWKRSRFYEPDGQGYEAKLARRLADWWDAPQHEPEPGSDGTSQ